MRRIDRYLLKEMLVPAFVGGVLVLILLVGNWLYVLLKYLYTGAPSHDILLVLLYRLPEVMMQALPASLMLGTALALNRLERDRELQSLRMAGVRLLRLVAPYILLAVLASGALFVLQEKIIPKTAHAAEMISRKLAWGSPTAVIPRDVVFKVDENFLYVREVDPNASTLFGVLVFRQTAGGPTWLTIPVAENHGGLWYFRRDPRTHEPPRMYSFNTKGDLVSYLEVEGKDSWLNLKQDVLQYLTDQPSTPKELTLQQLRNLHDNMRGTGSNFSLSLEPKQLIYYLNTKLAIPLSALVAVLIAIPLAVHYGRSGGYVGLLLSVVVAFCFVVSQQWTQVLAETDRLEPIFAAWAPDAFFGLLGLVLLLREE